MLIEHLKKPEDDIRIVSTFPACDEGDFPMVVFFTHRDRKYMTFSDDMDFEKAARAALRKNHVMYEDFCDVMQCILCIIMATSSDFCGIEPHREAFEREGHKPWPKVVYVVLHDIVKFRLHPFFSYGDGKDNLCIYLDILSQISFPAREACLRPL